MQPPPLPVLINKAPFSVVERPATIPNIIITPPADNLNNRLGNLEDLTEYHDLFVRIEQSKLP